MNKLEAIEAVTALKAYIEATPEAVVTNPEPPVPPEPEPEPPTPEQPTGPAPIVITGPQGFTPFVRKGLPEGQLIDFTQATFTFDNNPNTSGENRVPVLIEDSPGVRLRGGRFDGNVLIGPFDATYVDGSHIRILNSPNAVVENMRMKAAWDGIRIRINSNGFLFKNIHMSGHRDDMIENDYGHSGTVAYCLLDGGLAVMGLNPPSSAPNDLNASGNHILFDNVVARCTIYNQGTASSPDMTHGAPFKCNTSGTTDTDRNPTMEFRDCAIAIETITHNGMSRQQRFALKAKATNSFYINLSDTPLPKDYPLPVGFTKVEGSAGREKYAAMKSGLLAKLPAEIRL